MPSLYAKFIGVDVSKNKLDVYETENKRTLRVCNEQKGIKSLLQNLKASQDLLVLIDLTGSYETTVTNEFFRAGFNIHKAQGRKVKNFVRCYGQNAKTDKLDAKMQETLRLYQHKKRSQKSL